MARSYKFAIIRLAPDDARDERLNIGALVVTDHGLDVHVSHRLEKVRAISAALDTSLLAGLIGEFQNIDRRALDSGIHDPDERLGMLARVGPLSLSGPGNFVAENSSIYDTRIASIMRAMVDPEPMPAKMRQKRSRLLTQMKRAFRRDRVLAQRGENLESHRIVSDVEMDTGLIADLVLQNGMMNVIEAVDASSDTETPRTAIGNIGISALVLERARMKYGNDNTKTQLVYSASSNLERVARVSLEAVHHQGAELINWESADDRNRFVRVLGSIAEPIPRRRKGRRSSGREQPILFV